MNKDKDVGYSNGRGGNRINAGRPSNWLNGPTQTIRVPEIFASLLLEIAHKLDSGLEDTIIINKQTLTLHQISKQQRLSAYSIPIYRRNAKSVVSLEDLIRFFGDLE